MERISVIKGDADSTPVILIAPHAADGDDLGTGEITRRICDMVGCYGIINNGFERADKFDYFADKCDCNNIDHCLEDVVKEEFLEPIEKAVDKIIESDFEANIFIIHGMMDPKKTPLDMVIGYGDSNSNKPSYSCELWRKDGWLYALQQTGFTPYVGKAGGKYAGATSVNLNQFYRQHHKDDEVHSMQIEIIRSLRIGTSTWKDTAEKIAVSIESYLDFLEAIENGGLPKSWSPDWEKIAQLCPGF